MGDFDLHILVKAIDLLSVPFRLSRLLPSRLVSMSRWRERELDRREKILRFGDLERRRGDLDLEVRLSRSRVE